MSRRKLVLTSILTGLLVLAAALSALADVQWGP